MSKIETLALSVGLTPCPVALSPHEVTQVLRISRQRLNALSAAGVIPNVRISERRRMYLATDLETYLTNRGAKPAP